MDKNNLSVRSVFTSTVGRINHFEGNIYNIIGVRLKRTSNKEEIEEMQNAIEAHSSELIDFLTKVFKSVSMASHLCDKIYYNCHCMNDFYLNFDYINMEHFLFNDY